MVALGAIRPTGGDITAHVAKSITPATVIRAFPPRTAGIVRQDKPRKVAALHRIRSPSMIFLTELAAILILTDSRPTSIALLDWPNKDGADPKVNVKEAPL